MMNKVVIAASLCLMMILAFCGCGSKIADNTIQPWAPEDEQSRAAVGILSGAGSSAFAEYTADESFQSVKLGIDYFKDGKLVKDESEGSTPLTGENGGAKPSQGVAGFLFNDGTMTVGISEGEESVNSVSNIEMDGYSEGDDTSYISIDDMQEIQDGKKIYLGVICCGGSASDAVLEDPNDTKELKGKNWLPYVIFSTEPLK